MEPEPKPQLVKSRNWNFSKVGTGTVNNSYGSTTLVQKAPPGLALVGHVCWFPVTLREDKCATKNLLMTGGVPLSLR
jgi:hypothetical protein